MTSKQFGTARLWQDIEARVLQSQEQTYQRLECSMQLEPPNSESEDARMNDAVARRSKWHTLGEYLTISRGTTYKSRLLGLPGPILLGLASIQPDGGFRNDSLKSYGGDSAPRLLLQPGDLYVSLKDVTQRGDLLGAVARVPKSIPQGRLTQDTIKLQLTDDGNSEYIYWLLRTPQYRAYCRARAIGTTNLSLSRDDFLAFPVPEPTATQFVLIWTLETIEKKIELNRRMNQTLEEMARALFHSWFVAFDPVRAKAAGRQPAGMDAATAALFPDAFEWTEDDDYLPTGWMMRRLDELASINKWSLGKQDELDLIEYVEISEVSRGDIGHVTVYVRGTEPSRARRRLRHGDTVLSTVRPDRGSHFLVLDPSPHLIASTGFAVLSPRRAPRSFVYCAATQPKIFRYLGRLADGGAYPAVRPDVIGAWQVAMPRRAELIDRFAAVAQPLFERMESNRRESRTLAEIRDTLLPRLLSGEVRVGELEIDEAQVLGVRA